MLFVAVSSPPAYAAYLDPEPAEWLLRDPIEVYTRSRIEYCWKLGGSSGNMPSMSDPRARSHNSVLFSLHDHDWQVPDCLIPTSLYDFIDSSPSFVLSTCGDGARSSRDPN